MAQTKASHEVALKAASDSHAAELANLRLELAMTSKSQLAEIADFQEYHTTTVDSLREGLRKVAESHKAEMSVMLTMLEDASVRSDGRCISSPSVVCVERSNEIYFVQMPVAYQIRQAAFTR